jgi:hypothetical protein
MDFMFLLENCDLIVLTACAMMPTGHLRDTKKILPGWDSTEILLAYQATDKIWHIK